MSLRNSGSSSSKTASMLAVNRKITDPIPSEQYYEHDYNQLPNRRDGEQEQGDIRIIEN